MNILSGIIFILAYLPYLIGTYHGDIIPPATTWIIWGSIDTLLAYALWKEKTVNGQIIAASIGASTTACFALIFGTYDIHVVDIVCFALALVGIFFWKKYGDAKIGVWSCIIVIIIATIPTFIHGYNFPLEEGTLSWSLWTLSSLMTLFAIKEKNLMNILQPLTFILICGGMYLLVVVRPYFM